VHIVFIEDEIMIEEIVKISVQVPVKEIATSYNFCLMITE